jgi:hypothetical protein
MPIRNVEIARKIINCVGVLNQTFQSVPVPAGGQVAVGALTSLTTFTVAHGLGYQPSPWAVSLKTWGVSGTAPAGLVITALDATNVTIQPSASQSAANTNFFIIIDLDTDIGGRNPSVLNG